MKKILIMGAVISGFAFVNFAKAVDGSLNFTGTISGTTCDVNTASQNVPIPMGNVSAKAFSAAGQPVGSTKFSITLINCPAAVTSAAVNFGGPSDPNNRDLIAITPGTGVASGVAIALYEDDGSTLIPLNTNSQSKSVTVAGPNVLTYIARYMSTAATVGAGTANAVAEFTMKY